MASFFKMFRAKKSGKENGLQSDENRKSFRRTNFPNDANRRDKRPSRLAIQDDFYLRPTAAYHTITQPKHNRNARSCVGRDEYDRYRSSYDYSLRERNGGKYEKRLYQDPELHRDGSNSVRDGMYDPELDSDDSFDSRGRNYTSRERTVQELESKLNKLMYRLQKEEEKKISYKNKLMSERIVRQHVESKFVEDIQRLTQLVESLKNEQKAYQIKITMLEKQLKELKSQKHRDRHFVAASLFCTPPTTSNDQSGVGFPRETLCSDSSTMPVQNVFKCNAFHDDGLDEVKNFRVNEVCSSLEIPRVESSSRDTSDTSSDLRVADFTILNSASIVKSPIGSDQCSLLRQNIILMKSPVRKLCSVRRTVSENDVALGKRATVKSTNL